MIEKVVAKHDLTTYDEVKANLAYWLSKTPEERVGAIEVLRRQLYGYTPRLQRVARVIKRT